MDFHHFIQHRVSTVTSTPVSVSPNPRRIQWIGSNKGISPLSARRSRASSITSTRLQRLLLQGWRPCSSQRLAFAVLANIQCRTQTGWFKLESICHSNCRSRSISLPSFEQFRFLFSSCLQLGFWLDLHSHYAAPAGKVNRQNRLSGLKTELNRVYMSSNQLTISIK